MAGTHVAVLVNPVSGRGAGAAQAEAAVARLRERGVTVRVYQGASAAETVRLGARAVADGPDVLAIVGGDGTVSSVLGPVLDSGVPVAVLGGGTGNDFAREHGIPRDAAAAADLVLDGARRRVDAGTVTAADGSVRHFVTIACAGYDSLVAERANRLTWPRGGARYDVAKYIEALRLRSFDYVLHADGVRHALRGHLVAVGLGRYYGGGKMMCPQADTTDGLLDVTHVGSTGLVGLLTIDPRLKDGSHLGHAKVTTIRAASIRVEQPAGLVAYADGDRIGPLPVTIEAHRQALTLCVPR